MLADIEQDALDAAEQKILAHGVKTLAVPTDVSDEAAVQALAKAAFDRFGAVHVVCNNAGVVSIADPWLGPVSAWKWVLGVNLWGVVHGIRAFMPMLALQGEGHIVNTASMAGLLPGFSPAYDATKHAVVADPRTCTGDERRRRAGGSERPVSRLGAHEHPGCEPQLADDLGEARAIGSADTCRYVAPGDRRGHAARRPSPTSWPRPSRPSASGSSPTRP